MKIQQLENAQARIKELTRNLEVAQARIEEVLTQEVIQDLEELTCNLRVAQAIIKKALTQEVHNTTHELFLLKTHADSHQKNLKIQIQELHDAQARIEELTHNLEFAQARIEELANEKKAIKDAQGMTQQLHNRLVNDLKTAADRPQKNLERKIQNNLEMKILELHVDDSMCHQVNIAFWQIYVIPTLRCHTPSIPLVQWNQMCSISLS
jgi:chromosome segregation ATPase